MAKDAKRDEKKITPRDEDYSQWFHDIILRAGLAEYAPNESEGHQELAGRFGSAGRHDDAVAASSGNDRACVEHVQTVGEQCAGSAFPVGMFRDGQRFTRE